MASRRIKKIRRVLSEVRRVSPPRLGWEFGGITLASLAASLLDAIGILLLIPLVTALAEAESTVVELPLLSDTSVSVLLVIVVVFLLGKTLTMAGIRWWSSGVVARAAARTSGDLMRSYMYAPMRFHDQRHSAELIRTSSATVDSLFRNGVTGAAIFVSDGASLVALGVLVLVVSPVPAMLGIIYFGVCSLLYLRLVQPATSRRAREIQLHQAASIKILQEGLGGWREHVVRQSRGGLIDRYRASRNRLARAERASGFIAESSRYYLEIIFVGGFGVMTVVTLATVPPGDALATLAVLLAVGFRILPAISRVLAAVTLMRIGRVALGVITTEIKQIGHITPSNEDRFSEKLSTPRDPGALEIRGVGFVYSPERAPALSEIDLTVPAGTSLGIVGRSGAGKSTLIDLLCGLRTPDKGEIKVNDQRLDGENLTAWRRAIGYVPQDVFIVDGTLAENICFGLPLDDEALERSLAQAQLADLVAELPDGVATVVGERGTRLSGGQRQRIGIARALYTGPSVLVLDEATAALDVQTEAAITAAISDLADKVTVIIVAHRLSTIRNCDQIAYLDAGRLVAVGAWDEVRQQVPAFETAAELAGIG